MLRYDSRTQSGKLWLNYPTVIKQMVELQVKVALCYSYGYRNYIQCQPQFLISNN